MGTKPLSATNPTLFVSSNLGFKGAKPLSATNPTLFVSSNLGVQGGKAPLLVPIQKFHRMIQGILSIFQSI